MTMSNSPTTRFASTNRRLARVCVAGLVASGMQFGLQARDGQAATVAGDITVKVFRDYNANGTQDIAGTGEPGLGNVQATATCVVDLGLDGVLGTADDTQNIVSGIAAVDGSLTLAVPGSPCRVEILPDASMDPSLAAALKPGAAGDSNVQFVNAGDTIAVGLNIPSDYCQSSAKLAMTCFAFGDNVSGAWSANQNLHVFNEDAGSISVSSDGRATAAQIGSTFGVAYQRSSKTIFTSAYMKGHTGFGPSGPWAIYKANPDAASSGSLFVDLNSIGAGGGADPHAGNTTAIDWAKDYNAVGAVGKFGIGGITVGDDDSTLWAVNMSSGALLKMDIGSGAAAVVPSAAMSYSIPTSQCSSAVGTSRPFAVTAKNGAIWVGGVCEGIAGITPTSDVAPTAWVMKFDLTTNAFVAAPALQFSLAYERGCAALSSASLPCSPGLSANFGPWRTTYAALQLFLYGGVFKTETKQQPMLTGITFVNDDMVVALRNRDFLGSYSLENPSAPAEQHYNWPAGELLRSCTTDRATWALENNGAGPCPGSFARPAGGDVNPGPGGREFYVGDSLVGVHEETTAGGIVQIPGHANLQTSINDPLAACSAGFASMSPTGTRASSAELYSDSCLINSQGRLGKANGIGDLEALCDQAPIQIGNRVWVDVDADGVQDPGEQPIAGVTVNLYDPSGTKVGTATTGANGTYLFGGVANSNLTSPNVLATNTAYGVRLDNPADIATGGPLYLFSLTAADRGTNNAIDSDATALTDPTGSPVGSWPTIAHTTGAPGANDHTLDFGFFPKYAVGNRVWIDTNENGTIDAGEVGVDGAVVNICAADATGAPTAGVLFTQATTGGGYYRFDDLPAGRYVVSVAGSNFAAGGPLVNHTSSKGPGQEANADLDGDRNDNGLDVAPSTNCGDPAAVVSGVVTLGPSASSLDGEPTSELDVQTGRPSTTTNGRENLTVDFGFVRRAVPVPPTVAPATVAPSVITTPGTPTTTPATTPTTTPTATPATTPTPSTSPVTASAIPTIPTTAVAPACSNVGGSVFVDANGNGVRDPREKGVRNVTVTVVGPDAKAQTAQTDLTGVFQAPCLPPGASTLAVTSGVSPSAVPTNGPKVREFTTVNGSVLFDIGYATTAVKSGNIGAALDEPELAFTGGNVGAALTLALSLIAFGWFLVRRRRPTAAGRTK